MKNTLSVQAKVWLYEGPGGWHFITIPAEQALILKATAAMAPRGWGSVKIQARIGSSTWQTSVFPDKKSGGFLLPIKKIIRQQEKIKINDSISVILEVLD